MSLQRVRVALKQNKKYALLVAVLLLTTLSAGASSVVRGVVKEQSNNEVVPFAVVVLMKSDSTIHQSKMANTDGSFAIEGVAKGEYILRVIQTGFTNLDKKIAITEDLMSIGELLLERRAHELSEVTVTADAVSQVGERVVVNLASYMNTAGKNASDVLKYLPGVSGYGENVSVAGKSVTIFINGKQQYMSVSALDNYLKSIRADNISKIEILENPSSKYDSSITGAIIDIKLKRNENYGVSGNASLGSELKRYYPTIRVGGDINYRAEYVNVFGSIYFDQRKDGATRESVRRYSELTPPIGYSEKGVYAPWERSVGATIGSDFFVAKTHTIGALINAQPYSVGANEGKQTTQIGNENLSVIDSIMMSQMVNESDRYYYQANLNHKWDIDKEGSHLNSDVSYFHYRSDRTQKITENTKLVDDTPTGEAGRSEYMYSPIDLIVAQMDYQQKLPKSWQLLTGIKYSYTSRSNDFKYDVLNTGSWTNDPTLANRFLYSEHIGAAYLGALKSYDALSFQLTLRAEYTDLTGEQTKLSVANEKSYIDFFPAGSLSYKFNKNRTLTLSYSNKISRPPFSALDPFTHYTSPFQGYRGNPDLKPAYTHSTILSFRMNGLSFTAFYNNIKDKIGEELLSTTNPQEIIYYKNNIGKTDRVGLNISYYAALTDWYDINAFANVTYLNERTKYLGDDFRNDFFTGSFSLYNTFHITDGLDLEVCGFMALPSWNLITKSTTRYYVWSTLTQQLWKKRASVSLSLDDIFNLSSKSKNITNYGGMDFVSSFQARSHTYFTIGFSYRFGSDKVKQKRQRETGTEETQRRL